MGRTVTPPPGSIRSVQRGVISVPAGGGSPSSATATLSPAVNVMKASLRFNGYKNSVPAIVVLTNSTTVTASIPATATATDVAWEVTDYY